MNMNALRYQSKEHEIADLKHKLLEMSKLCQQLQEQFELMENKVFHRFISFIGLILSSEMIRNNFSFPL